MSDRFNARTVEVVTNSAAIIEARSRGIAASINRQLKDRGTLLVDAREAASAAADETCVAKIAELLTRVAHDLGALNAPARATEELRRFGLRKSAYPYISEALRAALKDELGAHATPELCAISGDVFWTIARPLVINAWERPVNIGEGMTKDALSSRPSETTEQASEGGRL